MDDAKTTAPTHSVLVPTGSNTMHRIFTIKRLFAALLRSLLHHRFPYGSHVHKVLAYPIRRLSLPSNAVLVFYIMNPLLSPFGKAPAHRRILSKPLFL